MTTTDINVSKWRYCRAAANRRRKVLPLCRVLTGDALAVLRTLPSASVDCVITSPPYFQLRRYNAGDLELGSENNVDVYIDRLVTVCDELARVLTSTGSMHLNIGDAFSRAEKWGAARKSMLLAPERLLLRMIAHGWIVRNKCVWVKTNGMPGSQRDRFTTRHEFVYFLVRQPDYYFDLDIVREPHTTLRSPRPLKVDAKYGGVRPHFAGALAGANDGLERTRAEGRAGHPLGKNPTDVTVSSTAGFRGHHWAVMPEAIIRKPLLSSCPEHVCTACGEPWRREVRRDYLGEVRPSCRCDAPARPGIVLDPFIGAGTVAVAAERHGRGWLGIEMNPTFSALTESRVASFRKSEQSSNERREG